MWTVVDAFVGHAAGAGLLTFLDDGSRLTWRQLHERALRFATVLARQGVSPGKVVSLDGQTNVDTVTALQAIWLCGAAVSVVPPGRARGIVATELAAMAQHAPPAEPVLPDATDLAVVQYTSGSTRDPRPVRVTHGHLAANLTAIRSATGHAAMHPCRTLSWLPLYHDMGLIGFLTLPMSCGCDLFLQSPRAFAARPASWLHAISSHRITASGGPNFAFGLMTRLLATGLEMDLDLSCLRFLLTGGEPVDATTMKAFVSAAARHGLDPAAIVPAYGLAEATLAVSFGHGLRMDAIDLEALETKGIARPGTRELVKLGAAVPGTSVRIVDQLTGDPLAERVVGHVEVSGRSVVDDGWLRTGDLGYQTDGELVICGRAKDVLFAAGRNIFPQDIEAAAAEVPGVRPGGAVAFGVPGEHGDRVVVAVEAGRAEPAIVRGRVAQAVLVEVGVTPATVLTLAFGRLPRTSSGKLRRAEARRLYLEGALK